jgi:hypothetical protein
MRILQNASGQGVAECGMLAPQTGRGPRIREKSSRAEVGTARAVVGRRQSGGNRIRGRMKHRIDLAHVHTELCHALTLERCAIRVYRAALPHVPSAREWARWSVALDGARANEAALLRIFDELALAPCGENPQRASIDAVADLLVARLEQPSNADRAAAARAAVRVMERREQLDWRLFAGLVAPRSARAGEMPRSRGRVSNRAQPRRATSVPALAA